MNFIDLDLNKTYSYAEYLVRLYDKKKSQKQDKDIFTVVQPDFVHDMLQMKKENLYVCQ